MRDCNRALHIAIAYHRNTNDKCIFWADLNRLRARKICERDQEKVRNSRSFNRSRPIIAADIAGIACIGGVPASVRGVSGRVIKRICICTSAVVRGGQS